MRQRDLAVVCAVLMAAVTTAMLWNNFGREFPGLEEERAAVSRHRELLAENLKVLTATGAAWQANQQEVERLRQAKRGSP
jgi:hypothetical protein